MPPVAREPPLTGMRWREVAAVMRRPQPFTLPMGLLFAIIPLYLYIGVLVKGRRLYAPETTLDRMMTLDPAWSIVYLSLFGAAILPVFVLHQQELIRRTVLAFIMAWVTAYAVFLAFPTVGPRTDHVTGPGFNNWVLREIYASDHRYNCFPSLHVAQCFLAAFAAWCVHRGVGAAAFLWAFAVGLSTVYTKQHYVVDVAGGMALAGLGYLVFLRPYPRAAIPENERRLAPTLALCAAATYGAIVLALWLAYVLGDGKAY